MGSERVSSIIAAPRTAAAQRAEHSDLIADWASCAIDFAEKSRASRLAPAERASGLAPTQAGRSLSDACRVRDELNNRLERSSELPAWDDAEARRMLRDADARFLEFTVESDAAQAATWHNHYAQLRQWWWRRLPVGE